MRINKLFSNWGYCSRKETNRLIEEGRVIVNGEPCILGQWVEETDEIILDNEKLKPKRKIYMVFNKPVGVTCTAAEEVQDNIISFINYPEYIFPVGRLDKASEGLMFLTNDGELGDKILDAENYHEKEYIVRVHKAYEDSFLKSMAEGVEILKVKTKPCRITRINEDTFRIVLTQGLNKQIRRMTKVFGYEVVHLKRIRIINLELKELESGTWRYLTKDEELELKEKLN